MPHGLWVSKYAQNPFGAHLKEHQHLKKATQNRLPITKEVQGARRVQTVGNTPYHITVNDKVKTYEGKDLHQALEKNKL